nr:MAG: putative coat protein [Tombusvirus sp.]
MALVVRNPNKSIVPYVAPLAAKGATAMYNNRQIIYDGLNWIYKKVKRKGKGKNKSKLEVVGSLPGAITAPVATSRQLKASKPKFVKTRGGVTISHREYITQVNGVAAGAYTLNRNLGPGIFRVNPTNSAVFPWLLNIASSFDKYCLRKLSFHYVPMCATTEVGRVGLFFDKDSEDTGPFDRAELANMAHLAETPPWGEVVLQVPCDNIERFMNDSPVVDNKLVDLGRFGFAVYGGSGGNPYGDIFVQYTIELREPQPSSNTVQWLTGNGGNAVVTTTPNFMNFVAFAPTLVAFTPISAGTYLITFILDGTTMTAANISVSSTDVQITSQSVVVSATKIIYVCQIVVSTPGNNINFNYSAASGTFWNMFVARVTRDLAVTA